jgi:hypothetical protein
MLITTLDTTIVHLLSRTNSRIAFLSGFAACSLSPQIIPTDKHTFGHLHAHWHALQDAQHALNALRAAQLTRLATIFAMHPTVLKALCDPSQEQRANPDHLPARLRHEATCILRARVLDPVGGGPYAAREMFRYEQLPIVPYDRYLKLFLKVRSRYPLPGTAPYKYPRAVATAVDGLAYIYTTRKLHSG